MTGSNSDLRAHAAHPGDAAAIATIYNQGIEDRVGTFETEPRTPDQIASRALLRRLGFREAGVYRRHGQLDGVWRDCVIVEKLERDDRRRTRRRSESRDKTKARAGLREPRRTHPALVDEG